MSLKDQIKSLSYFKNNMKAVVAKTTKDHQPIILTQNGEAAGVFMDIESFEWQKQRIAVMEGILEGEASLHKYGPKSWDELKLKMKKKYGF